MRWALARAAPARLPPRGRARAVCPGVFRRRSRSSGAALPVSLQAPPYASSSTGASPTRVGPKPPSNAKSRGSAHSLPCAFLTSTPPALASPTAGTCACMYIGAEGRPPLCCEALCARSSLLAHRSAGRRLVRLCELAQRADRHHDSWCACACADTLRHLDPWTLGPLDALWHLALTCWDGRQARRPLTSCPTACLITKSPQQPLAGLLELLFTHSSGLELSHRIAPGRIASLLSRNVALTYRAVASGQAERL